MSRIYDRQKAIDLRKQGLTYTEIKSQLRVAKSTLCEWLSNYPLTDAQMVLLHNKREHKRFLAIEKTRLVKQKKREERIQNIYNQEVSYWNNLSKREIELAGIFLYWGEGKKSLRSSLSVNNTDPDVLKFMLYWFVYALSIPKEKIKVDLQLYSDMDKQEAMHFWSKELNLPLTQFVKPYIKTSKRTGINHKGFGYGTCGLVVNDVLLKEKVIMAIKAIALQSRKALKA